MRVSTIHMIASDDVHGYSRVEYICKNMKRAAELIIKV